MGGGFRLDNRRRSSDNLRALFSIFALGIWDGEAPVEKMAPTRKCNWRKDFAWIAKLPDNGMALGLCVTDFSILSGDRTDVRRHQESARHSMLAKSSV